MPNKSATLKRPANRRFAGARGWAALTEYVDDKLREARRAKRIAERACAQSPRDYWDGHVGALSKLKKNIARWEKAQPKTQAQRPRTPGLPSVADVLERSEDVKRGSSGARG